MEGSQRRVRVLRGSLGDCPGGVRSSLRTSVAVRVQRLPHREKTIDIGVMEPEDRVECGGRENGHVSCCHPMGFRTTSSGVDGVVETFQAIGAFGGALRLGITSDFGEVVAVAHHRIDTILHAGADVVKSLNCLALLAGRRGIIGGRISQSMLEVYVSEPTSRTRSQLTVYLS